MNKNDPHTKAHHYAITEYQKKIKQKEIQKYFQGKQEKAPT